MSSCHSLPHSSYLFNTVKDILYASSNNRPHTSCFNGYAYRNLGIPTWVLRQWSMRRRTDQTMPTPTLHTTVALRRTWFNRGFALVYSCALIALLYHHFLNLLHSTTITITILSLLMLLADAVLAFMWATYQAFRMCPISREAFPDNLSTDERAYPPLDMFICTADPYKEPPMGVVNTALSIMAYDYPTEKLSVYVSDDGGSQLTLFAFTEAAKFARHWLPYCRNNNVVERCPKAYFKSDPAAWLPETDKIKVMYESMKIKVERVVEGGSVPRDYISDGDEEAFKTFSKWTDGFTPRNHPAVIQVMLESGIDKDVTGHTMPNLVYVSREKSEATPHHFKAGALNVLLRVSAAMTNAPIILTLDCDMYSNDLKTPLRALCYFLDPSMDSYAYVQFPQLFHGISKNDIYDAELKYIFQINLAGMDGLLGPVYVGTGCFFRRRVFFGSPAASIVTPELLSPHQLVNKPIKSCEILALAHDVAASNYEVRTKWGSEVGFKYGSLVEDVYTGYGLQCQGWKSIFCYPNRAAFLGDVAMTLDDVLSQTKRWTVGLLEIGFSKYSPITFGFWSLNHFQALCYAHYAFWPIWSIPITIYAFLPQLALIKSYPIFPKVSDPWFLLYVFLPLGAYGQDFLEFVLAEGTVRNWWNSQRMWMVRGLSSFSFGLVEYILKSLGISTSGFNVTSKVVDSDHRKRYDQGMFEFGVASPLFVPITTAVIINLFAFIGGSMQVLEYGSFEDLFLQIAIAGFAVANSWPIVEAMVLRTDQGKMHLKITLTSTILAWILYKTSSFAF